MVDRVPDAPEFAFLIPAPEGDWCDAKQGGGVLDGEVVLQGG